MCSEALAHGVPWPGLVPISFRLPVGPVVFRAVRSARIRSAA